MGKLNKIIQTAEMVKFSHSIFALPFALASMLIAAQGLPSARLVILIILAMVTGRNAAMAFNRYMDAEIDAKNPRTSGRHIPQGIFSKKFVLVFALINAVLFSTITFQINRLCFWLSFPALLILFSYSLMKRWTDFSHLVLGLALGISPLGAWIAVTGGIRLEPVFLGIAVILWVAGFDIIYATQDCQFDRNHGLHSLVVRWGIPKALKAARLFHGMTLILLFLFGRLLELGWIYNLTLLMIALLFLYEHSLVRANDLSRVNAAFFNMNGFVSLLFLGGIILSI